MKGLQVTIGAVASTNSIFAVHELELPASSEAISTILNGPISEQSYDNGTEVLNSRSEVQLSKLPSPIDAKGRITVPLGSRAIEISLQTITGAVLSFKIKLVVQSLMLPFISSTVKTKLVDPAPVKSSPTAGLC